MTNLVAVSPTTHRGLRIAPAAATPGCAAMNAVSVIPREFARLLAHYPIVFTKSAASGRFEPAVLLGFAPGENLFLTADRWDATYVPLQIQRLPFSLLPRGGAATGSPATLDVALDMDSAQLRTAGGERLFEADGEPTKFLQRISDMLAALASGATEAYAFTGRLAELALIEPVRINIEFVDGSETTLAELYWIAAPALKRLPAPQLQELRDRGFLEWLYFQMASMAHLSGLIARKNRRLAGEAPPPEPFGA